MTIRTLSPADASAFHTLRLRALREEPQAFGSAYEDELTRTPEQIVARLQAGNPDSHVFGAFDGEELVGLAALWREVGQKMRHRASVHAVYVAPEARGRGIARQLIDHIIAHARDLDGLRDVALAVTVGNAAARQVYLAAGFVPYAIEPRHLCIDGVYYDFEHMILDLEGG
jgi:ribosomal protein S18 acetylase RimI-like enzyme